MNIYALSDLHLSFMTDKPMDIFGSKWENYEQKIEENWNKLIKDDDVVIIAGDISWAMKLGDTKKDFEFIEKLNGRKVILKGNHDYWWSSLKAVKESISSNVTVIQNDAYKFGNYIVCGTRGWVGYDGKKLNTDDQKIYDRELIRLEMSLKQMEKLREEGDKVICAMHFPPYLQGKIKSPFTDLIEKYKVDKVVFAHLHGDLKTNELTKFEFNNIEYILTSCDKIDFCPVKIF